MWPFQDMSAAYLLRGVRHVVRHRSDRDLVDSESALTAVVVDKTYQALSERRWSVAALPLGAVAVLANGRGRVDGLSARLTLRKATSASFRWSTQRLVPTCTLERVVNDAGPSEP